VRPAPVTTIERTSSIAFTRWKKSMGSLTVSTPSTNSVSKVS
jgi:hypothetical protein